MAKQKTTLRVDVYPAEYTTNGTGVRYRFKVVTANGDALAYSAKSYARPSLAWNVAAKLLIDPVDEPSSVAKKRKVG
jgi:hypothetical protein